MAPAPGNASNFIKYLATYKVASSDNDSLFDEKVPRLSKKYNIQPLSLRPPMLDEIVERIRGDKPLNILISGVAGDGKTHLSRRIWNEIGGQEGDWIDKNICTLNIKTNSGLDRKITFIKDLTDGNYSKEGGYLDQLVTLKSDPNHTIIIACNHGQLLQQLGEGNAELQKYEKKIEEAFFGGNLDFDDELKLYDLTRTHNDQIFKDLVQLICTRSEWDSCASNGPDKPCPFKANRDALYYNGSITPLTERIAELLRLADYEGHHFTMREMLSYISNLLLGCKNDLALYNANSKVLDQIDIYENVFGENYTKRKNDIRIFSTLSAFKVGSSTTRKMDAILMNEVPSRDTNGDEAIVLPMRKEFLDLRDKFLNENLEPKEFKTYGKELERARRRLFLTWNPEKYICHNAKDKYSYWHLTTLPHAGTYLANVEEAPDSCCNSRISTPVTKGLACVMAGSRYSNRDVYLTTNGANVDLTAGSLLTARITGYDIKVRQPSDKCKMPVVELTDANGGTETYRLTPSRYEVLVQLSEGYSISSFSQQSLSDLIALKAQIIHTYRENDRNYQNAGDLRNNRPDSRLTLTLFPNDSIEIEFPMGDAEDNNK